MPRFLIICTALLVLAPGVWSQPTPNAVGIPITAAGNRLQGPVKEMFLYGENLESEAHWTEYYRFDSDGHLFEYEEWSYGGGNRYLFHYAEGRLVKIDVVGENMPETAWLYVYDSNGCPQWQIFHDQNTADTVKYQCDSLCRIVEEREGHLTIRYSYDAHGRIATQSFDDAITRIEYNDHGLLSKKITQSKDFTFTRTETYTYNAEGCLIQYEQTSSNDDEPLSYQLWGYTYDRYGNWLTVTGNGYTQTRTITYYEEK